MRRLSDVVRVERRFQRSIRVDTDGGVAAALDGFVCAPSIAQALIGMATQVAETGHGAFTWTGPYGSGKSSLALALAALLGPEGACRERARAAVGPDAAGTLLSLLPPGPRGWTLVPVVGRRSDPASAVMAAVEDQRRGGHEAEGSDVVGRLRAAAASSPGGGLLLVIDEMGKFLEYAVSGGGEAYFFQQLAEAAARSQGRLIVVGILHHSFDDYANRMSREVRAEWAKIQGRFTDMPINVAGEEQIALIARAIAGLKPPAGDAANGVCEAIRRNRPSASMSLAGELALCWPLNPVVASLLGPLSRRRFGQNQRSVFGFLNSPEPCGFQEFLGATEASSGRTYDPPMLWDYLRANLEPSILASPDGHRWSLAVDAVERCDARGGCRTHSDLVKAVALIDLFKERSGLISSPDVLAHALPDLGPIELARAMEQLLAWSVVIHKRHVGAYSVYAGSDFDIDAAVGEARARASGIDFTRLRSSAALQPVLAKRHYHRTGALRWFDVDLAPLAGGADAVRSARPRDGATGLFLLLVSTEAEAGGEVDRLRRDAVEAAALAPIPVVVGSTRDNAVLRDLAAELMALEAVRAERAELNGDAVARREVDARIARAGAELEEWLRQAFVTTEWTAPAGGAAEKPVEVPVQGDLAGLNLVASSLADRYYPASPLVHNELLNRVRPSSNAISAQKALLRAMVEGAGLPRLGISGFPAEGGLYSSVLEQTRLHGRQAGLEERHCFVSPDSADDPANLAPLWAAGKALLEEAGTAGAGMDALYRLWQSPPFGVRDGLLPVLSIAFLLSHLSRLSVYLDGAFQPTLEALLVERLAQEAGSVRLRWTDVTASQSRVVRGLAEVVASMGGPVAGDGSDALGVARGLVGVINGLNPWTLRTSRISETARSVRDLVKSANDPNRFLLDDVPRLAPGRAGAAATAKAVVETVRAGISELASAYAGMLQALERTMLAELRIPEGSPHDMAELKVRAENVRNLTGNYRLDAFTGRLLTYERGGMGMEAIASLAANKPPRDWVDRDVDQAAVEIASLAGAFLAAESLAHVKGRKDYRTVMALHVSDPRRPAPVRLDFQVTVDQEAEVLGLVAALWAALGSSGSSRDTKLAALVEVGARLADAGHARAGERAPRPRRAS